jgi:catechol 2,3-dioxygenase-like lactoylglutathione lyase family enzyme
VALVTTDLDATTRFYGEVLGMEIGGVTSRDARGGEMRHCFVRPGGTESWGLHFFESPDSRPVSGPEDLEGKFGLQRAGPHHIAFALPDEEAGLALRERLEQNGVASTPIGDAGPVRNTLFLDNNGLLLEAAWPGA